jgi:hypothetical protein
MLRKILMFLGILVAFLPYLGIPREIDAIIYPIVGLSIFFLLVFSKKPRQSQNIAQAQIATRQTSVATPYHAPSKQEKQVREEREEIKQSQTSLPISHIEHDTQPGLSVVREEKSTVIKMDHQEGAGKAVEQATSVIQQATPVAQKPQRKKRKKISEVLTLNDESAPQV